MVKTFPYKGSKRKLIGNILDLIFEVEGKSVFDGFSGTGIVGASARQAGLVVQANDLGASCYIAGSVFLNGFNPEVISKHINILNELNPVQDWIYANYSGEKIRSVRAQTEKENRPRGFTEENAGLIDAARNYVAALDVGQNDKNALIFAIILAANKVFNGANDQKSALKEWHPHAKQKIYFDLPDIIDGPVGIQTQSDILKMTIPKTDVVYLDPPYGSGVLYPACYHINDSLAVWDKPETDQEYAIPRPLAVCFDTDNRVAGGFYSRKHALNSLDTLLSKVKLDAAPKRIIISYSDAPRNVMSLEDLAQVANKYGTVKITDQEHNICAQPKSLNKISTKLIEYFISIDS